MVVLKWTYHNWNINKQNYSYWQHAHVCTYVYVFFVFFMYLKFPISFWHLLIYSRPFRPHRKLPCICMISSSFCLVAPYKRLARFVLWYSTCHLFHYGNRKIRKVQFWLLFFQILIWKLARNATNHKEEKKLRPNYFVRCVIYCLKF